MDLLKKFKWDKYINMEINKQKYHATEGVLEKILDEFFSKLTQTDINQNTIEKLQKLLLEEKNFTDNAINIALFSDD